MRECDSSIEDLKTWHKYSKKLCRECVAQCCSLPVEVTAGDLIRMEIVDEYEVMENPKKTAKRLKKEGLIEHFHLKSNLYTLTRLASGYCLFLDKKTRRCNIYDKRPETCRNHPRIGPRPGYCAYSGMT